MSLAERLDDYLAPESEVDEGNWEITGVGSADWALRKLAKVEAEDAEVRELAESQIAAIEAWREAEQNRLDTRRQNWETLLAKWHRQRLAEDPDGPKSIRLPHGVLHSRKQPDNVEIPNPKAVLEWAKGAGMSYLRVIPVHYELDRSAIKDAVLKSGEIIPGVVPVVGEVRYSVDMEVGE